LDTIITEEVAASSPSFACKHSVFSHLLRKLPRDAESWSRSISFPPLGANPPEKAWDGRAGGWVHAGSKFLYLYYYIPKRGYLDLSLASARNAFYSDVGTSSLLSRSEMDAAIRKGEVHLHSTLRLPIRLLCLLADHPPAPPPRPLLLTTTPQQSVQTTETTEW